eukprot:13593473-Alexandrium_andersonii.AAC.1
MQAVASNVADILQTVEAAGKVAPPATQQAGVAGNLEPVGGVAASSGGTGPPGKLVFKPLATELGSPTVQRRRSRSRGEESSKGGADGKGPGDPPAVSPAKQSG